MPNILATLMLVLWPAVVWRLFVSLPAGRALIWSLLGAYLLLPPPPAVIDFPLMPAFDKSSLPNIAILIVALFVLPKRPKLMPDNMLARGLLLIFVLSPIVTVFANPEPLIFTENYIRGLVLQDAIAQPINRFILIIGFLMARSLLTTREDQRDLLIALVIAGLAYSIPTLLEVRLSPQLNNWVYGYYQHLFSQTIRSGGYRPMVFLYHGIWLAYFMLTCVLAALVLWRADTGRTRAKYLIAAFYLVTILVLCKTLATLAYAGVAGAMILLLSTRSQVRVAAFLAIVTLSYPMLKSVNLVPENAILAQAEAISGERAHSLAFRFENENILMARAFQKPLFGWGIWGRNHLHNPTTGVITSVSDGYWIIALGVWGWVGYLSMFGLMALPIFLIARELHLIRVNEIPRFERNTSYALLSGRSKSMPDQNRDLSPYLGPLALILGFNMIDLLPNATLTPTTWLIAGTLFGHAERLMRRRRGGIGEQGNDVPEGPPATPEPRKIRRTIL